MNSITPSRYAMNDDEKQLMRNMRPGIAHLADTWDDMKTYNSININSPLLKKRHPFHSPDV